MNGSVARGRRLPIGAEARGDGVHVRVWAPGRRRIALVTPEGVEQPLDKAEGYFEGFAPGLGTGSLYGFRIGREREVRPDPASRFQPEGPDGWSQVVDPGAFRWTDQAWPGLTWRGQVLYEMHVGTFTEEGTWAAAERELPRLAELGVTAIEMLPVAEFKGRFAWGYDGAALFAPAHVYGTPDDLRRFNDRAHALGLGVILDVVYNHLAPEGCHVAAFAPEFLSKSNATEWGSPPDFDGPGRDGAREFVLANVAHWIAEYHFDGLRLDATQDIHDESEDHILAAIARTAREAAAGRSVIVTAENERQEARIVRSPHVGGHGLDGIWSEDWHHAAAVALTGRRVAYQSDYAGTPQELVSLARWGTLFQGQRFEWQEAPRGHPALDVEPSRWIAYLDNHDQVANTGLGLRFHHRTSPGRMRAGTALLLLGPHTPLLFQGQEWASDVPFRYLSDPSPELRESIRKGRDEQMKQFGNLAAPEMKALLPDPTDEATFRACKLTPPSTERERQALALHRDLLRLRRDDPVIRLQRRPEGAVIGPEAFLLRFLGGALGDRLLIVNLGADLVPPSIPEPLLAPPEGRAWRLLWSSEQPDYGGEGTAAVEEGGAWRIPGHAAVLMEA